MQKFTNQEKAKIYDTLLFQYQRIQEEIRQIKSKNFEVSFEDQKKINFLEQKAVKIYNDTQRLYL
jgi:hypothetical protein